jgi:hypothetical protein
MRVAPRRSTVRCAVCHDDAHGLDACLACGTLVHADCRGVRCPTLGCARTASTAKGRRVDIARVVMWTICALALLAFAAMVWPWDSGCCHAITRTSVARADLRSILSAAQLFRLDEGRWPGRVEELTPRYVDVPTLDPWGQPYVLIRDERGVSVVSVGEDGVPGGGDDLSSCDLPGRE